MHSCTSPSSIADIVALGLCSGCGACAFVAPDILKMCMNDNGHLVPVQKKANVVPDTSALLSICPMSGVGMDETDFAADLWPDLPHNSQIGRYSRNFSAHLTDADARLSSGSGGLVTWLGKELLRRGDVDCVVHVKANKPGVRPFFRYSISRTLDEVQAGSKSRYYPVELSDVLCELEERGERAVIISIPCFIKAIRKLIAENWLDVQRTPYLIGLVCGHMKSSFYGEYLAWQAGIAPDNLASFDFRHKLMDRKASSYGFAAKAIEGSAKNEALVIPMAKLKGKDWGEGQMRLTACEFCDDVMAECADIAVGDAWLPQYVSDPKGENVVVMRDARIDAIVTAGCARGEIMVTALSAADVVQSQASGLRHRREGLAHRLARRVDAGQWVPCKRVVPALAPDAVRREIYDIRLEIAETSNAAFARARAAGDIDFYHAEMACRLNRLRKKSYVSLPRKVWRKLLDKFRSFLSSRAA